MSIPVDDELLPVVADVLDAIDPATDGEETFSIVERLVAKDAVAALSVATTIGTALVQILAGAVPTSTADAMAQLRAYLSGSKN